MRDQSGLNYDCALDFLIEHDLLRESVPEIESGLGIPRTVRQSSAFVSATPIDHAHSV